MECKTISHINKDNKAVLKNKKKYKTFEDAKKDADILNQLDCVHSKKVVYKCSICDNYHIGTSEISLNKEVNVKKFYGKMLTPKIVGKIDLNIFPQKDTTSKTLKRLKQERTDQEIEILHFQFLLKYKLL